MSKRFLAASFLPVLAVVLLTSCFVFGSRESDGGPRAAPAPPRPAWYVLEGGRLVAAAAGELTAAAPESLLPWTLQERVAAFARLGDAVYFAVNGYGVVRVDAHQLATMSAPGAANPFTYFYDRALFRGRTLRALLPETDALLCHVYRDTLLETAGGSNETAEPNLARLRPGSEGFQMDFVRPPFQAAAPGWQAVSVAREQSGVYWLEWKRAIDERVEFAYTTYEPATGRETRVSRDDFRNAYGMIPLQAFTPRAGSARDLLVATLASVAPADEYLHIVASDGSDSPRHYVRLPEGSGETSRQISLFADAGRAFTLEPDGILREARDGSIEVRTSRLAELPKGFVYSDLFVIGSTLVASWEQVDFFRVGRAGILVKPRAF